MTGALAMASAALLALANLAPGDVAAVCGAPGSGKSFTAQAAAARQSAVVVCDPLAQRDRLNWDRGDRHRKPWPGELVSIADVLEAPEMLDARPLRLVVHAGSMKSKAQGDAFADLVDLLWSTGGGIHFYAEEAGLYGRRATDAVNLICSAGGHAGLSVVFLCQSFTRLPADGRRNLACVVSGAPALDRDGDALRELSRDFEALARRVAPRTPLALWRSGGQVSR